MEKILKLKSELILASGSPRRKFLLEEIGLNPTVIPSNADESIDCDNPEDIVITLSKRKAMDVSFDNKDKIVIGADTIVVYDGKVFGKPKDSDEALIMLKTLSGKQHFVYTGVTVCYKETVNSFVEKTGVKMFDNSEALLKGYVDSGVPLDKAGAYGIQGFGSVLIESIEGDYYSVMGLPVGKVLKTLDRMGLFI